MTAVAYAVVGYYCPTDANSAEDAEGDLTAVVVATREDAENWLLWFPGGEIVPVRVVGALAERVEGREGMVTVYDHGGRYLGCMGVETWRGLLEQERAQR